MKRFGLMAALILLSFSALSQTTAFTYQGRLADNGAPVNGSYDLRFELFSAASNGTSFGARTNAPAPVTSGLFSVTLDFGAGAFTGADRWLEIAVRTNGGGAFVALSPRQRIASTPYAMFAGGASAAGLSGTLPASALAGNYSGAVSLTNEGNVLGGNGGRLTNLTATSLVGTVVDARLSSNVALRTGGNAFSGNQIITGGNLGIGTATPSNLLDVAAGGVIGNSTVVGANHHDVLNRGTKVSFGYNVLGTEFVGLSAVVNPGTAFCGNSGDLLFSTWECNTATSREVMRINGRGRVGIGTSTPATALQVSGTVTATAFVGDGSGLIALSAPNLIGTIADANLSTDVARRAGGNVFTGDQAIMSGNVGIGTSAPATKLTVVESTYGIEHTDGTRRLATYVDATGCYLGTRSVDPLLFYVNDSTANMTIATNGNVGIGTTSPGTRLTVAELGYGIEQTDGTRRLATYLDATGCYLGTRSLDPLLFYVNDGAGSMVIATNGNVGIGVDPTTRLDVGGTVKALSYIGDGSGLTALDANGIASGTLPTRASPKMSPGVPAAISFSVNKTFRAIKSWTARSRRTVSPVTAAA